MGHRRPVGEKTALQLLREKREDERAGRAAPYEHQHEFITLFGVEQCAGCRHTRGDIEHDEAFRYAITQLQRIATDPNEAKVRAEKAQWALQRLGTPGRRPEITAYDGAQRRSHGAGSAWHNDIEAGSNDA